MEQRRVILFLVLSFLVLTLNGILTAPPRQEDKQPPAEDAAVEPAEPADDQHPQLEAAQPEGDEPVADDEPETESPLEYITLGSVDKDSAYRMLVTLTNQGAAVRRVELASRRYSDLQDRGGYLGHLELTADPAGGLLVQVVGAGTPAAAAGIEPGDRIVSITRNEEIVPLLSPADLSAFLEHMKPRRKVTLSVVRGEAAPRAIEATLQRRPLEIIRPESENVLMRTDTLPVGFVQPPSFQLTLEQAGKTKLSQLIKQAEKAAALAREEGAGEVVEIPQEIGGIELLDRNWEMVDHDATTVTFRQSLPRFKLEVLKRYRLDPVPPDEVGNVDYPGYNFVLEVELRNTGQAPQDVAYQLDGPNGLPLEGWWYAYKVGRTWGAVGIRDVVARFADGDPLQIGPAEIATGEVEPMAGKPLAFIGVDAQYFSAVLLPQKPSLNDVWLDQCRTVLLGPRPKARSSEGRYANVTCRLISKTFNLAGGESLKHSYTVFAGPKRPDLLAQYQASNNPYYTLSDLLYYGWFGGVAKAMLGILHFFYRLVHNYGIAIILLTVLVRLCLFPISRKQAQSMARMQELRPEMEKIKEKYKSDMQKQSQAMQELYRKHNINPLAGCLPMFIQLPILLGLYRSLMVDVELRQAPLISENIRWCSDLAAPDMFWNWSAFLPRVITSGEGFFGLGPYLNILPLVTIVLFLAQQKMFMPEPTNEQAAMQQKVMKYMMIFMGLLFFKVASGLCIYFIASSLWGIGERKLIGAPLATAPATASATTPTRSRGEQNGQRGGKRTGKTKKKR